MSEPYLCSCGSLVNVAEIALGGEFRCPHCGSAHHLEATDPALLRRHASEEGIYQLLLEERIRSEREVREAQPLAMALADEPHAKTLGAVPPASATHRTAAEPACGALEATFAPGDPIGPYRVVRLRGRGGMGAVYEALDPSLERSVAVKVLSEEHSRRRETVERFQREARAAGSLTHPNVTHIYAIGEHGGAHYFAMELVGGKTLSELLEAGGPIPVEDALDYLIQVARGLRAARRKGIIHRDIKPSNLMLSDDGLVKVTDFGLAKVVSQRVEITASDVIIGTPLYMSPEQGRGSAVDHRSDIYSLGCSFYHLLAGKPPYGGENAMAIILRHITEAPPRLPDLGDPVANRLGAVILRMMAKEPGARFQEYEELIDAVSAVNTGTPAERPPRGTPARVVVESGKGEEILPADSLSLKLLSVADVSMELGRHEKALNLYASVIKDNPHLEIDLSFRMLKIRQVRGEREAAMALVRRILDQSDDKAERLYCRWKLLADRYEECLARVREARRAVEAMLGEASPDGFSSARIDERAATLAELEAQLAHQLEERVVLVRQTGDLRLELD